MGKKIKAGKKYPPILSHWEGIILVVMGALVLLAPIFLTQFSSFYAFDESTGVIGDTIGGITSPIIGIAGAYVVYKSFGAQIKANRMLRDQHEVQVRLIRHEQSLNTLIHMYSEVDKEIRKIEAIEAKSLTLSLQGVIKSYFDQVQHWESSEAMEVQLYTYNNAVNERILKINANLTNLLRMLNLIENYFNNFKEEKDAFHVTHFYVDKIIDIVEQFDYDELNSTTVIEFLDENFLFDKNKNLLENAITNIKNLHIKIAANKS